MVEAGINIVEYDLSQVWIVEDPVYALACFNIPVIDKYNKDINIIGDTKKMNEAHIAAARSVIEDVMTSYLFEYLNQETADNIKNDIALLINVEDFYDYIIDVKLSEDDIKVEVCIRETLKEEFLYINASYSNCPTTIDNNEIVKDSISAFDSAMKIV